MTNQEQRVATRAFVLLATHLPLGRGGGVAFAQVSGLGVRNKCQVCYYRQRVSVPLMEAKHNGMASSFDVKRRNRTVYVYCNIEPRSRNYLCVGETISTVIPRLTKIIRSGITFVSRNVISRRFL